MADGGGDSAGWGTDGVLTVRKKKKDNAETQRDAEERRESVDKLETLEGSPESGETR